MQKNDSSESEESYPHDPVLLEESIEFLGLKPGARVVDGTLGLGGHSSAILRAIGPEGMLYAFDRDERNIAIARGRLEKVSQEQGAESPNFRIIHDSFSSLKDRLKREGATHVDALLFDLGLSSPHIDDASRGFSFQKEGPLDMRFDASQGKTAADLLNKAPEAELADIFYHYGEERAARKLAREILAFRKQSPKGQPAFHTTTQFTQFIETKLGKGKPGKHRAVPLFQALRIAVNEELKALELTLGQAAELLAPQGRMVVISYHSLEDRMVKHFFKQLSRDHVDPTDPFGRRVLRAKSLSLLTKKPILPSPEEVARNKRARSAKLRAAEKL